MPENGRWVIIRRLMRPVFTTNLSDVNKARTLKFWALFMLLLEILKMRSLRVVTQPKMFTPNIAKVGQALQKLKRGNAKMHTDAVMTSEARGFFFRKTRRLKI